MIEYRKKYIYPKEGETKQMRSKQDKKKMTNLIDHDLRVSVKIQEKSKSSDFSNRIQNTSPVSFNTDAPVSEIPSSGKMHIQLPKMFSQKTKLD